MKKRLLLPYLPLAMMLASVTPSYAGNPYVAGSIGLSGVNDVVDFYIAPEAGYEFNKTWAVGGILGLDVTSHDGSDVRFMVQPYARGTFAHCSKLDFFGELGVGLVTDGSDCGADVSLRPGMKVNLNDHWSMTFRMTLLDVNTIGDVSYSIGRNCALGFQYTF